MEERSRSCHWQHRPHHWRRMASANTQNQRKKRKTGHHLRPPATSTLGLGLNGQRWNTFSPVSCATRCKRSLPSAGHFPGCKVCPSEVLAAAISLEMETYLFFEEEYVHFTFFFPLAIGRRWQILPHTQASNNYLVLVRDFVGLSCGRYCMSRDGFYTGRDNSTVYIPCLQSPTSPHNLQAFVSSYTKPQLSRSFSCSIVLGVHGLA